MLKHKVLVLNADYTPISIFPLHLISAQRAIVRVCNGTCAVVSEYEDYIPTKSHNIKFPAIVVRSEYLKREKIAVLNSTALWYRDLGKCAYCGDNVTQSAMTIDHVMPKAEGGRHRWDNVVLSCSVCNHAKGRQLPVGVWAPRRKPWKPTYSQLLKNRKKFPVSIYHESWEDFLGNWEAPVNFISI